MRRLIDKDALLKEIDQKYAEDFPVERYIMDCIRTAPVIDPVRHGYWIDHGRNRPPTCSECCGCALLNYESDYHKSDFCPHCGATMSNPEANVDELDETERGENGFGSSGRQ